MKTPTLPTKLFLFSTLLAAAVHCGTDSSNNPNLSTLRGRVSDGGGSQPQSLKILSDKLGGSGSIAGTAKVRVRQLRAGGSLDVVAEGTIQADGRYSIAVPPGQKRLIAESVDAAGNVMASAIVEASGSAGSSVTVTPMDTESSVEAAVLTKMAASGVALEDCNAIDLRERINQNVAAAVKAATDAEATFKALAEAVAAAQSAKIKAYAAAGVSTSQAALFDAELAAAQKLDVALDAAVSGSTADQAYETFHSELDATLAALDSSLKKHARAESIASVAFRAVIKARLGASGDAVADASVRAAASLEARLSSQAIAAILATGAAAADATTAAQAAATQLRTQLKNASTAAAAATAFTTWNSSLSGSGNVTGSVLGNYLAVNATTAVAAQASVSAIANAAAALDTAAKLTTGVLTATGAIDFNALAQGIVTAYSAFQTTADLQVAALAAFGSKAQVAVDVMATASGSLRVQ